MKKDFLKLFLIFSVFSMLLFSFAACSMENEDSLIKDNQTEETSVQNGKTRVSFSIKDYENSYDAQRSILPQSVTNSQIVLYSITGTNKKDADEVFEGKWNSYSELQAAVMELIPAEWTFIVSAFMNKDGDIVEVARCEKTITLVYGQANSVQFELGSADGNGNFTFKASFPKDGADSVTASLKTLSGTTFTDCGTAEVSAITSGTSYDYVTITKSDLAAGYYYLFINFSSNGIVTATKVVFVQIAGSLASSGEETYSSVNTKYSIVYNLPNGATLASGAVDSFNDSDDVTLPTASDLTYTHYVFAGWYTDSALTGTAITGWNAGDKKSVVNLYPKWTGAYYNVIYKDYAGGQTDGKTYSGDIASVPALVQWESSNNLGTPSFNETLSEGDSAVFEGWYSDAACTQRLTNNSTDVKNLTFDASDNVTVYAKWNYSSIYVDPAATPSVASAADTNRGFSAAEPLHTITEARNYLGGNTNAKTVYLLSTITYASASSDVNDISGISSVSSYGNGTNPVILKRHSQNSGTMVYVPVAGVSLHDITIDGGAVWDSNGAAGTNSGLSGLGLLLVSGTTSSLTLSDNVVLQNNEGSGPTGSALCCLSGTINSESVNNKIIKCKVTGFTGLVYSAGGTSVVNFSKGIIGGSSENMNYGCTVYNYSGEVNLGSSSNNDDGSDCIISFNKNENDFMTSIPGIIYLYGASVSNIEKVQIKNNYDSSIKMIINAECIGGAPTVRLSGCFIQNNDNRAVNISSSGSNASDFSLENCTITGNKAETSGAGIFVGGKLILSGKNNITGNYLSDGKTVSNIYYSYDASYPDRNIQINSNLTPGDGQSYVSTISLPESAYPTDESTLIPVFSESTSGLIAANYQLFACEKKGYKINNEGKIYCYPIPTTGNITSPLEDTVTFGLNNQTFTIPAGGTDAGNLVISSYINSLSAAVTDWSVSIKAYGLVDVTGFTLNETDSSHRTIPITSDVFAPGSYTVTVGAKNKGVAYSDTFTFTVAQGE